MLKTYERRMWFERTSAVRGSRVSRSEASLYTDGLSKAQQRLIDCVRLGGKTPQLGFEWPCSNTLVWSMHWLSSHPQNVDGCIMEFGVYSGKSLSKMSVCYPKTQVYAFDSFEGLPEKWANKLPAGHYNTGGTVPRVSSNVEIVKGQYKDTLDAFLRVRDGKAFLVHMSCTLHSSTLYVVENLLKYGWLVAGTVIVFDSFMNYSAQWVRDGEFAALVDAIESHPSLKV